MAGIVTTSKRSKKPGTSRCLRIGLLALVAVAIAVVFLPRVKSNSKKEIGKIGQRKAVVVSHGKGRGNAKNAKTEATQNAAHVPEGEVTNADKVNELGKSFELAVTNEAVEVQEPRSLKDAGFNGGVAEQIIGMMMSSTDKTGMTPLPSLSEEQMREALRVALTNDIMVFESDDEEAVAFKEKVADMKLQLGEILDKGGSITKALAEYASWIDENYSMREEVKKEFARIQADESLEEALAYLQEANKALEAEGVMPVVYKSREERLREHREAARKRREAQAENNE